MNLKEKILIISIVLCILFSISSISASDVNDTSIISENDYQDSISFSQEELLSDSDNGTFTSLQKKIDDASSGDIITLDKDYTYDDGFDSKGIVIKKDLTLNGNGHTLNALSKSRIFNIEFGLIGNYKVVLNNITFKNGHTEYYGGAILNFANLTVSNCVFKSNYAYIAGGAINSLGHLTLKKSTFNKNSADGSAGAVFTLSIAKPTDFLRNLLINYAEANLTEIISTVLQNTTIEFAKEYVSNCKFTGNTAKANAGAVYAFGHISITSSKFKSNTAGQKGGAVFGNKDLYITNSKFTSNKASLYGGAVYFRCHELSGNYVNGTWVSKVVYYTNSIKSSTFTKNSASKGGAIYGFRYSDSDKTHCAKASKCTFTANKASSGRDIYGGTASNCVFNYLKLTLKTVTVKKSAKKLVLSATLKKGNTLIKGKKITFKFNGKTYKATTNKKGVAKATVKQSVLKKLTVGKKIKYQAKYSSLTVTKKAKVKK